MAEPTIMEHSCLPWFNKIVEINKNNGWVRPQFKPITTEEFSNRFFMIEVDDFLETEDNYEVDIFRVCKRWDQIIFYCKVTSLCL